MSREPNAMDTMSARAAELDRETLLIRGFDELVNRLERQGDAAGVLRTHHRLAEMFQRLAVLDTIVYRAESHREAVLSSDNATARLFAATAEADDARTEGRARLRSTWTPLEQAAGATLDAIAARPPADTGGVADDYRSLRQQLLLAHLVTAWPLAVIHELERSYRAIAPTPAPRPPTTSVFAAQLASAAASHNHRMEGVTR